MGGKCDTAPGTTAAVTSSPTERPGRVLGDGFRPSSPHLRQRGRLAGALPRPRRRRLRGDAAAAQLGRHRAAETGSGDLGQDREEDAQPAAGRDRSAGPAGKTGKTGPKGATGAKGRPGRPAPKATAGSDGTGPAFEVFATGKRSAERRPRSPSQNLPAGAYAISANVVAEGLGEPTVTCNAEPPAKQFGASIPAGGEATLSLSVTRHVIAAGGNATLSCIASTGKPSSTRI